MPPPARPTPHSRPWPSASALVVLLSAIAAAALLNRPPTIGREPQAATVRWPETPGATAGLRAFLDSSVMAPASLASEAAPPLSAAASPAAGFRDGIALGLFSKDLHYDYGMLIGEIAEHEAGWVSLFFNMYQKNGRSTSMAPLTRIEDQERIFAQTARQAHGAGLKVLAFPLVLLRRPADEEWRGNLQPKSIQKWFESYGDHILRLARVAEETGIEAFCIGSEFSSLESEVGRWSELIDRVREVFSGEVIYSANWDHYTRVPFWDRVDLIGLSGYYELTASTTPTLDELVSAWDYERDRIMKWRDAAGLEQPIVFTEIGYPNQDGANMHPWDYTRTAPPDPAEQALCYEAFVRTWHGLPGFGGVFFYNWFGYDTLDDTSYSPRGKPAAELIKTWFDLFEAADAPAG